MRTEYNALLEALRILETARNTVNKDDGPVLTPHWAMLSHAHSHLYRQAQAVLKGE